MGCIADRGEFRKVLQSLNAHPAIHKLDLGLVHLPDWHPRHADKTAPIFAYLIEHPDGNILFDCGCGSDNTTINALYNPAITSLERALGCQHLSIHEIAAVVVSHLHFDHCGQLPALAGKPVYVQRSEIDAAAAPGYTVPDWSTIAPADSRTLDGDADLADGLRIFATPGHTTGHQSLIVSGGGETTILGGQCCYRHAGMNPDGFEYDNLHGPSWESAARDSLARLRSIGTQRLFLAHA
jgi:N-acyl homoserine lactone hydrolase